MAWSERGELTRDLTFNEAGVTFNQQSAIFDGRWFREREEETTSWDERAETADVWTERT